MHDFAHVGCCSAMGTLYAHMHDCWGSAGSRVCKGMRPQRERASALCCTARGRRCSRLALPQACSIVPECSKVFPRFKVDSIRYMQPYASTDAVLCCCWQPQSTDCLFWQRSRGAWQEPTLQGLHGLCSGQSRKDIEVSPSMLLP